MPTINKISLPPEFTAGVNALALINLKGGFSCPPLIDLLEWTQAHAPRTPIAVRTIASPSASAVPTIKFDDAVLEAVTSSTVGVGLDDLKVILAHYGTDKVATIPGSLGRLKAAGKIVKLGEMWCTKTPAPAAAAKNGKVDRTIGTRRTTRAAAAKPPRTRAAKTPPPAAAEQQQAGAAE